MKKLTLFSGIQPSGNITIGNYIGTIKKWINLQKKYRCIFCIADLHSITKKINSKILYNNILNLISIYLACGINPKKNIIFVQSHVKEHAQLNWILGCYAYFGELNRMNQFKKKNNTKIHPINSGLFNYPTLMAADILLYQTNYVSIGIDQIQHIEFTKKIAKRFNQINGKIFTIPKILISKFGSKILSLINPQKKMSKSDTNKKNVISLLENPKKIFYKINKSQTDSDNPPKIIFDIHKKPGISNLLNIIHGITNSSIKSLEKNFLNYTYKNFKNEVSFIIYNWLKKIQKKFFYFRNNKKYLIKIINTGAKKAKNKAKKTLQKVYKKIGFI